MEHLDRHIDLMQKFFQESRIAYYEDIYRKLSRLKTMTSPSTLYLPAHRGYPGVVRAYNGLPNWREKMRRLSAFAERSKEKYNQAKSVN
jgi:hypothetical protein